MKILQIIPSLQKGGAERLVLDICNELVNHNGIELQLVTFSDSNEYTFLSKNINWKVIPASFTPSISGKSIMNIQELQSFINSFQPDIIHSHLWESEFILSQIKCKKAIWFTHFHSNMPRLNSHFSLWSKRKITDYYEKKIVLDSYKKKDKCFITISNDANNYARKILPNSFNNRILLLKNAINCNNFSNPSKEIKNTNNTIRLVSVGSLVVKKNHIFLVHVIKHLKNSGIDCVLLILGEGVERTKIQELVLELKLEKNIFLKGNVNDVSHYLNKSDIYVHSAIYEPFGLVLLEAMAAGLPIVSLDGKGNRDIIHNGVNGFILSDNDYNTFGNQVIELFKDENIYYKIQNNAIDYVKTFDIKQYVIKLLKIYQTKMNE